MAPPDANADFATTRWTLIASARDESSPQARAALDALCRAYWYPLYAFVRRQGHPADRAEDLTQDFFARFVEKDVLGKADRARGKFRSFLLASCKNFLANQADRERAEKRGGRVRHVPLDAGAAESRFFTEPADALTPERLFERCWALALLEQVMSRLRQEYETAGKGVLFDRLKAYLTSEGGTATYAELAERLGRGEGTIKSDVFRLRKRYGELLRDEIARTLDDPAEVEDEIRGLMAALASRET